jgi:hypothetical protein
VLSRTRGSRESRPVQPSQRRVSPPSRLTAFEFRGEANRRGPGERASLGHGADNVCVCVCVCARECACYIL